MCFFISISVNLILLFLTHKYLSVFMLYFIYVIISWHHFLLLFLQDLVVGGLLRYQSARWAFWPLGDIILFQFWSGDVVDGWRLETAILLARIGLVHGHVLLLPVHEGPFDFIVLRRVEILLALAMADLALRFDCSFDRVTRFFDDSLLLAGPLCVQLDIRRRIQRILRHFFHILDSLIFRTRNQQFLAISAFWGSHEFLLLVLWDHHVRGSYLAILDDIRIQGCPTIRDFGHMTHRFALKLVIVLHHVGLLQPTAVRYDALLVVLMIFRWVYFLGLDVSLLAILLLRGHDLRYGLLLIHWRIHMFSQGELLLDAFAVHLHRIILLLECVSAAWVSKRRILIHFVTRRGILYHELAPRISYFFACWLWSTGCIDVWVLVWAILATLDLFWFKILGRLRLTDPYIHPLFWIAERLLFLEIHSNFAVDLLRGFIFDVFQTSLALFQLWGWPWYYELIIRILLDIWIFRYHYAGRLLIFRPLHGLPFGHVDARVLVSAHHSFLAASGTLACFLCRWDFDCFLWRFEMSMEADSHILSLLNQFIFVLLWSLGIEGQLQIFCLNLLDIVKFTVKWGFVYYFV